MPTLQDVARLAGVSTATVSKVLSNTPYFSAETREKVLQAVAELGYRPNLAARALSSGKTHIIAVVFPYVYEAIFTDPLVLNILQGVETECTRHGYNILLSSPHLSDDGLEEHYFQLLQSGYIEGLVAIDNVPLASVLQPALERGIPGVTIGYHDAPYFVRSQDYSGGHQLMSHVTALGHRCMGIISVPEAYHYSIRERVRGMRAAAAEAGLDYDALPHAEGDFSIASGSDSARQMLHAHPDLTALISLNDRMAMGAIQAARACGRSVPDDLTVVGYDNIPSAATFAPPLTTIDQHAPELGAAAMRMLLAVLAGAKPDPVHMPTTLVVRDSSAPKGGDAGQATA